jgi:hypothetical protein
MRMFKFWNLALFVIFCGFLLNLEMVRDRGNQWPTTGSIQRRKNWIKIGEKEKNVICNILCPFPK